MFSFIKKSITKHDSGAHASLPADNLDSAVDKVLFGYQLDDASIANRVTKIQRHGTVVTLDLRLPATANPEKIHRELSQQLHAHGITEVNLNVSLPPKQAMPPVGKAHPHRKPLPKTIDAAALPAVKQAANQSTSQSTHQSTSQTAKASAPMPPSQAPSQSGQAPSDAQQHQPAIGKRAPTQASLLPHPRIKHIIVVASGKGGVGKSTTTVNIALALQKLGNKVGILDADIYGPSIPTMLGVAGIKPELENQQFVPIEAHGLAILSIGNLLDGDNTPVAWRGPKATGALMQLFSQTNWPMLDYLVLDMPPGTGDIQLTLAQRIPVTGAVIVTTPQHIALMDAQKGIEMFHKTNIPVLGVVENMALHTCSNCGHSEAIFGAGGGDTIAKEYQVPLLGQLPLAGGIRAQVDKGEPSVIANAGAGDDYAKFYLDIAKNIAAHIAKFTKVRDDGRIF